LRHKQLTTQMWIRPGKRRTNRKKDAVNRKKDAIGKTRNRPDSLYPCGFSTSLARARGNRRNRKET